MNILTVTISEYELNLIEQEFYIYWSESGANLEADADYGEMEQEYILDYLCVDEYEVSSDEDEYNVNFLEPFKEKTE